MDTPPEPEGLVDAWPLFHLKIQAGPLTLRLPRENDLPALAAAARTLRDGPRYQLNYLYDESPGMERALFQRYWRALAHWTPESWHLTLGVFLDGIPIGLQEMWANDFAALRSVETSSWIRADLQGNGYGTLARAGALALAFETLGAAEAHTAYLSGNEASYRVSRKLGYHPNGFRNVHRNGETCRNNLMILEFGGWDIWGRGGPDWCHRGEEITITGADRALFGINN